MIHMRRVLGPLVALWLLCQAGSAAAVWMPEFDDCACPHGDGAVCPMHHGGASRTKTCSMRGMDHSAALTIVSLLSPSAPVANAASFVIVPTWAPVRSDDRSLASLRPVPPDPPPPRV